MITTTPTDPAPTLNTSCRQHYSADSSTAGNETAGTDGEESHRRPPASAPTDSAPSRRQRAARSQTDACSAPGPSTHTREDHRGACPWPAPRPNDDAADAHHLAGRREFEFEARHEYPGGACSWTDRRRIRRRALCAKTDQRRRPALRGLATLGTARDHSRWRRKNTLPDFDLQGIDEFRKSSAILALTFDQAVNPPVVTPR